MVLALQFVNRPEAVDSIYSQQLVMDRVDINNCEECEYRYYVKGLADIALGNPEKPIEMYHKYGSLIGYDWVKDLLIKAYIVTENKQAVAEIVDNYRLTGDLDEWRKKSLMTAKDFILKGDMENAHKYFDQLLQSIKDQGTARTPLEKEMEAYAHFYKEEYKKAAELLWAMVSENPTNIDYKTYLAMALIKSDEEEKAIALMRSLDDQRAEYQYGSIDYAKARYYAIAGNEEKVIQYLMRAVSAGKRYTADSYQYDVLMKPYAQSEAFKKVLSFWH